MPYHCEDCGNDDQERLFWGICTECGGEVVEDEEDEDDDTL